LLKKYEFTLFYTFLRKMQVKELPKVLTTKIAESQGVFMFLGCCLSAETIMV